MFALFRGGLLSARGVAFAAAAALAASFCSGAQAKHKLVTDDPDQDAQVASPTVDQPPSGDATVIRGEFVESHDLLGEASDPSSPEIPGIQWRHEFAITLSGKKDVTEKWTSTRIGRGPARSGFRLRHSGGRFGGVLTRQNESSVTIGENAGRAVWHVLGANKLQRIFPGQHFLMIMNIEVGADKACRLEVKYLRQEGFVSVIMRRATTGELTNFSLPRPESASCTIESAGANGKAL
ncbi:MAG: hypothetical protein ACLQE9_17325 [Roseiarcus sp.]